MSEEKFIFTPEELELRPFDPAKYLQDVEAQREYIRLALEDPDPNALLEAIGHVARARGMSETARASSLKRSSLYKALRSGAQPRYSTIRNVLLSLGLQLDVKPVETAH